MKIQKRILQSRTTLVGLAFHRQPQTAVERRPYWVLQAPLKRILVACAVLFGAVHAVAYDPGNLVANGTVSCADWGAVRAMLAEGYSVKLANDMTVDWSDAGTSGSPTLDMNGKTVYIPGDKRAFALEGSQQLTITGNGTFTRSGSATYIYGGTVAFLYGSAKLTLVNGTFKDLATSCDNDGGAVSVHGSATFIMNGGTISGCSARRDGGAITFCTGTFTMNGGTISGCSARWGGGGVYVASGSAAIYGGEIRNNYANAYRGAIGAAVKVTVYGGYFAGNAAGTGMALFDGDYDNKHFDLYGCVVDGYDPAGLDPQLKKCDCTLMGGASSCKIGSLYVVGKNIVSDANGKLTVGTYAFCPTNAEYVAAGVVDPAKVSVTGSGTSYTLKATGAADCNTWAQARANLDAGNDVRLVQDVVADSQISVDRGQAVTVDLGGRKLAAGKADQRLFWLSDGSLTIQGGMVDGNGYTYPWCGQLAYVVSTNATLTVSGVTVQNMKSADCGGAICVANGVLTMTNATIRACSAASYGGGIYNYNGSLNLVDCAVEDCTSAKGGGGVFNQNKK